MIIIKYLAFLYCQYKNNKENFYLHYIKLLITFLGKKNSELIFFQLKYYFNLIILSKDVNKKENCLLKWNYFNDYEPILALRNKEFSQKLNFLKKIREYLKNGMIIEILQDVKNFSKYFDYKNIIYFVLLFVFKSLESLFKDDLFNYYYSGKDTSDILNLLLKIENSNAGIEELKENYLKKRKIPLKCNKLNRKEIFTKENLLYLIYLIYQFLIVDNQTLNLTNIFYGLSNIDFNLNILFLLLNLKSKTLNNRVIDHKERLVSSVQIENLSNKNYFLKKLNNIIKNIINEILTIKDLYLNNNAFYLKILRFNFKINHFREIYCEKIMNNLNKIITSKLAKLISLLFKEKNGKNTYQILSHFIRINEFKSLFNAEQTVNIIYKFKEKDNENEEKEEIKNLNDIMIYMRCFFTFFTFLVEKIGKSKSLIFNTLFNLSDKKPQNKKYLIVCNLMEEFIFLFYIFMSLMNCLLIHLVESKKIVNKNLNLNLGIEYLINLMKISFFYSATNKDSDFIEMDLILRAMNSFIQNNYFEVRLLHGFYLYCSLEQYLENRKSLIETINDAIKKKTPIYYEKIKKICIEKELNSDNNDFKRNLKFIKDYDQDFLDYLSNVEELLKLLPRKEFYKIIVKNSKKRFFSILRKSELMMNLIENYIDFDNIFANYKDSQKVLDKKQLIEEEEKEITQLKEFTTNDQPADQIQLDMFSALKDKINKRNFNRELSFNEKEDSSFLILKENKEIDISNITIDIQNYENQNDTSNIKTDNLEYSFDNQSKYLSDNSMIYENVIEDKSNLMNISFFDFDMNEKNENSFKENIEKSRNDINDMNNTSNTNINDSLQKIIPSKDNNEKINVVFSFNNNDKNNLKLSVSYTKKKYISTKFIFMFLDSKIKKKIFKLVKKFKNKKKEKEKKDNSSKLKELKKNNIPSNKKFKEIINSNN